MGFGEKGSLSRGAAAAAVFGVKERDAITGWQFLNFERLRLAESKRQIIGNYLTAMDSDVRISG